MTALVLVGASGWFGQQIRQRIADVVVVPATSVLTTGGEAVRRLLDGRDAVVVNAAGARTGTRAVMERLNVDLPAVLAEQVELSGSHLVHLGSAAEYGTSQPGGVCDEGRDGAPESDYGRTKLAGTLAVLARGRVTVLRVFNVAASPPQPGTPLEDIARRLWSAATSGTPVELLSAGTVRDWVRPEFVHESVLHAALGRPEGVFNVCSGVGVRMGDAAELALARLGAPVPIRDLAAVPPSVVIGTSERWATASGLSEQITASDLADVLCAAARTSTSEGKADEWKP